MKKSTLFKLAAGIAVGAAAAIAVKKAVGRISEEIKNDLDEQNFVSPDGDNIVTVSCGSSETARGFACISIKAVSESKDDDCKLTVFAMKKGEFLSGEWEDNEHFRLLIGNGKNKQCCDISFDEEEITAHYYLMKI